MGGEYLQLVGWEWCGDGKEFHFSRKTKKLVILSPPSHLTFREMCKLTNQSFSHLLVWFRELCETNPGDNLMDSWIERTWIIQTWISNTILSVLQKRENRNTFLGTFELYLIGMHQPVLPLKRVLREVESSFLGLVSPDGWEKNSWALGGLIGFQSLSNMLKNFFSTTTASKSSLYKIKTFGKILSF